MAEVNVVRTRPEANEFSSRFVAPWFEVPLLRSGLFTMNPFALMKQFTDEMDRAFYRRPADHGLGKVFTWEPAIEVKEKEGRWMLTADLPGMKPEEIKVHVDGNALVVEGERKQEKEEKREGYFHSERSYGKFYRTVLLPEGALADKMVANFNNGVLEVTAPLTEKAKRQEIPVKKAA